MKRLHGIFTAALLLTASFSVRAQAYGPYSTGSFNNTAVAGSSSVGTYLGEVATRASVPAFVTTSNSSAQTRTAHFARTNITTIGIGIPNWYVQARSTSSTPGETAIAGTLTATASIEYPAGTFHQLTFSGAVQGAVSAGGTLLSDQISVTIPKGALFFVRMHLANSAGIALNYYALAPAAGEPTTLGTSSYDVIDAGTNIADATMGGTITPASGQSGITLFPVAIIGQTNQPAICIHGDSRSVGLRASTFGDFDNGNVAMRVGPRYAYINLGVPGETTADANASYTRRLALTGYCTGDVIEYGINDIYISGASAATTLSNVQAMVNAISASYPSHPIVAETLGPVSTSTDGFATTTNQTTNASVNPARTAYNFDVRSGQLTGIVEFWDITPAIESGGTAGSGVWLPYMPLTDGLHESLYGNLAELQYEDLTPFAGNQ